MTNGRSARSRVDEQRITAAGAALDREAMVPLATGNEALRKQIQSRLGALRRELETGQAEFEKMEQRQIYLRETMLRISGAIQVLEELLMEGQRPRRNGVDPNETQLPPAQAHESTTGG